MEDASFGGMQVVFVEFDLATLPERAITLIVQAAGGQGWLAGELQDEQGRRERVRRAQTTEGPSPLILPMMDEAALRTGFREIAESLIFVETREVELRLAGDDVAAAEMHVTAEMFHEILQAIKRAAQGAGPVN